MNSKKRAAWEQHAADTLRGLDELDPATISKEQFLLMGAALAILDHEEAPSVAAGGPEMPSELSPLCLAGEELLDADKYAHIGEIIIARDELRHAQHFIDKARGLAYTQDDQAMVLDLQARHDLMAAKIGI